MRLLDKRVALVVPHRLFDDDEYAEIRAVLEREGCRLRVVAASLQPAIGMRGTRVRPEELFSDVDPRSYDAAVFVGGTGARDFWSHPRAHNLVRAFDAHGRVIGAICLAPVTLARAGILKDNDATCHPEARRDLEAAGARYVPRAVETQGRYLTANGPQSSRAFAEALVALLAPAAPV